MANVLFKRGIKSALPNNADKGNVVDGTLYFTTDTCQLYLGHGTSLLPIGDNIRIVSTANDLGSAADHKHEFAYVSTGNIMAWSDGSAWKQTNPNTTNSTLTHSVSTVTDGVEVSTEVTDSAGGKVSDTFNIVAGSQNVTIAGSGDTVTITVSEDKNTLYTMTASANGDNVNLVLAPTSSTTVTDAATSTVTFKDSTSVNVFVDQDGAISFGVNTSGVGSVGSAGWGPGQRNADGSVPTDGTEDKGFHVELGLSNGTTVAGGYRPVISYAPVTTSTTSNGETVTTTTYTASVEYINGIATLDVYSKGQIDTRIQTLEQGLNAMTYRGVASTSTTITSTTIHNGDTWKATGTFTIDGKTVEPGYLIIATGTEVNGVIPGQNQHFDVISGDAQDTRYSFEDYAPTVANYTTTGWKVTSSTNPNPSTPDYDKYLAFLNADFSVTDSTKVELATVTVTTTASTAVTQSSGGTATFTAISNVSYDTKGRITGIETKQLTVVDTLVTLSQGTFTVTAASNTATVSFDAVDTAMGHATDAFSLSSAGNSITVTASGKDINVDLVWGQF